MLDILRSDGSFSLELCVRVLSRHSTRAGAQDALGKGTHGPHCCFPGDPHQLGCAKRALSMFPCRSGCRHPEMWQGTLRDHIDAHPLDRHRSVVVCLTRGRGRGFV